MLWGMAKKLLLGKTEIETGTISLVKHVPRLSLNSATINRK